ncbi:MAG: hypothetical protein Q4Q22_01405 [Methanosphaera sp.]|nr:hypothetical protein [Methanosphaera sp.]
MQTKKLQNALDEYDPKIGRIAKEIKNVDAYIIELSKNEATI